MSFREPLFLLALAGLPLIAWLYRRDDARRSRAADAFASPVTRASVAPRRPGWRRHAPAAAYAAALAVLAVALARPETTVAVEEERAAVVLATDGSGSMQATDVAPSRLAAVREAGRSFLQDAPGGLRVGVVTFGHRIRAVRAPRADRDEVRRVLDELRPAGGTATGDALAVSLRLLERRDRDGRTPPAAVVLLSDGKATHGRDPVQAASEAAKRKVPVHTVALGTDSGTIQVPSPDGGTRREAVPPDRATLARIAELTGGRSFDIADADDLADVYEELGSKVATRDEKREVTGAFAAGAGLLLFGGGLLSLRWFGRLP